MNNLDISKGFDIGLADKLQLSFGLEQRWEQFQNRAGEADSYRDGGYVVPIGTDPWHRSPLPGGIGGYGGLSPSPGLVSLTGTSPADARTKNRSNYTAYAEVSTRPFKPWAPSASPTAPAATAISPPSASAAAPTTPAWA